MGRQGIPFIALIITPLLSSRSIPSITAFHMKSEEFRRLAPAQRAENSLSRKWWFQFGRILHFDFSTWV